jgi:hypothetical protein
MSCPPLKKIEFYYTYESLTKKLINDTNNLKTYSYQGKIYKDKARLIVLGDIFIEQIVDENNGMTKSTVNVSLKQGYITYILFHTTIDGKSIQGELIGPVIYGTEKYLSWNSSNYYSRIINYQNDSSVTIYKK